MQIEIGSDGSTPRLQEYHVPALLTEAIELLLVQPDGVYVDATLGGGGHARAILDRLGPNGRLLGLDQDADSLERAAEWATPYGNQLMLARVNFENLATALDEAGVSRLDGALFDLGVSSHQLDVPDRGFSFRTGGPLDMRMDRRQELSAEDIVQTWAEQDIAGILWKFGEERHGRRIARAIVRERKNIKDTADLASVVRHAMPPTRGKERIHPATRTFQALRIAVNREMDVLAAGLNEAVDRLAPGGRIAVIAWHSLEDRIVKEIFRERSTGCICPPRLPVCRCGHAASLQLVTRKPVAPSEQEIAANPRARSARLRVAERVEP